MAWAPNPQPSYLHLGGALSLAGSKGEHPGRARGKSFTIGHDSTLSLHGGDNIITYLPETTLYLQTNAEGRAYNFGGAQRGRKRENDCGLSLLKIQPTAKPGCPDSCFSDETWDSQKIPTVVKPDSALYHLQLKS